MGKSRQNRSKAETSVFPFQTSETVEYTKTPLSSKCQSGAKKVIERNKWYFYQWPLPSLIRKGLGHLHNRPVMHVIVPEV